MKDKQKDDSKISDKALKQIEINFEFNRNLCQRYVTLFKSR